MPTLSVTAVGTVPAAPDTAVITVGVTTEAESAGAALADNNARMRKLIDDVLASGVADRDIATSNFRIEPRMVFPPQRDDGTQDAPKIVGYQVDNTVTVRIRDLAKAGDLLDKVVKLGANQVQGVSFIIDDDRRLLDKARVEAVKAADAKAAVYAEAGGFRLKRILSIREEPLGPGAAPSHGAHGRPGRQRPPRRRRAGHFRDDRRRLGNRAEIVRAPVTSGR